MARAIPVKTSTPGVYKVGSVYMARPRVEGRQIKVYAKTKKEVVEKRAQLVADLSRGEYRASSGGTFGDYANQWVDTYAGRTTRGFREETRVGYRRSIEKATPFFDGRRKRLAEIEPQDVRAFIAWLFDEEKQGKALSLSTVRNHVAAVRALFGTAAEDGVIRHNPAYGVRISKPGSTLDTKKKPRALERKELVALLGQVPEEWRLFVEFLLHSGVRIAEAVEVRWRDIEFGAKPAVHIERRWYRGNLNAPKSANGQRRIPLSPAVAKRLWKAQGAPEALVFDEGGDYINQDRFRRNLKTWAKAAGIEWSVTPHTFRHTCASLLFEEGRNVKQVKEWLGHHDEAFTLNRYVHLLEGGLGDATFFDGLGDTVGDTDSTETPRNDEVPKAANA